MSADIPRELVEQLARGNGVIFVGPGLSVDTGLPGWNALLTPLAESILLRQDRRADLLKVAQYYENACGRQALIAYLQEQTDTTGRKPAENHRRLARLGVRTWVTTNYDDLVEQTLRETNERFNIVVRDQDLPYVSADAVTLLKLHGDRNQPDTIVITEQDYRTYFRRFPRVKDKLTGLLLEKTFLFVGYGVNDPDFNQLRAEIAYDLHQHARMAYAILFDADEFTLADLKAQNMQVINVVLSGRSTHKEQLGRLLNELVWQVDSSRQQKGQDTDAEVVITPSPDAADVSSLLEAMGYRISDSRAVGTDQYFLCKAKWGVEINQELIHFVGNAPTASDIAALNDAVLSHRAARGIMLTRYPLPAPLRDLVRQRERIQCYALDEFTDRLADFRPYLERLIADYEAGEISQYYVPLSVEAEIGENGKPLVFKPIESFVDTWLTEPGRNHLSILGDFGSGKTWFCQHYTYLSAKRYLADPVHNRVPILITLRDHFQTDSIERLITDVLVNRHKVALPAAYKAFDCLNRAGRLLLILDGFDEIERHGADYRTVVETFWDLSKVVRMSSKVLLTGRPTYFRHDAESREALVPTTNAVRITTGNQIIDLMGHDDYQVAYLKGLDSEDIRLAVQKRLPSSWESVHERIGQITNLTDLASRPVLLEMIVRTLPQLVDGKKINLAALYQTYVEALLGKHSEEDIEKIVPRDRLILMQELALHMYSEKRASIAYTEFPEKARAHLGLDDSPRRIAFFERDMRTQSYLVRDEEGRYRFAHRSFMEFFVASKIADELQSLPKRNEKLCTDWKGEPVEASPSSKVPSVLRARMLPSDIAQFLADLLTDNDLLWKMVIETRGRDFQSVGYWGSNALKLLSLRHSRLSGKDLCDLSLRGTRVAGDCADSAWENSDLQGAVFSQAKLIESNFVGVNAAEADFSRAELSGAEFSGANLKKARFTSADLEETVFEEADLTGADFSGARLLHTTFHGAILRGAHFAGAYIDEPFDLRRSEAGVRRAEQTRDWRMASQAIEDLHDITEDIDAYVADDYGLNLGLIGWSYDPDKERLVLGRNSDIT